MIIRSLIGTLVISFIFSLCATTGYAQAREKKGYLSLNTGPTWLPSDYFSSTVGTHLAAELGYEIGGGFGVAATWLGAAFTYEGTFYLFDGSTTQSFQSSVQASYGFLGLGPMYSIRLGPRSSIHLRGRVGRFFYQEAVHSMTFNSESQNISVGYFVGAACQHRLTDRWSLFGSLEYGNGRKPVTFETYQPVNSLAMTIGFGVSL